MTEGSAGDARRARRSLGGSGVAEAVVVGGGRRMMRTVAANGRSDRCRRRLGGGMAVWVGDLGERG